MAEWDTASICERIIRDARVPKGAPYRAVAALLPIVDRHLRTAVVPRLLEVAEDHLSANVKLDVVSGKDTYRVPWRSLRLLDVALLDDKGDVVRDFGRATARQARDLTSSSSSRPRYWALEASSVVLYPPPNVTGYKLRLRIARRPGQLVDSTTTWLVKAVGSGFVDVTGPSQPPVQTYDFIKGVPGFEALKDDATTSSVVAIPGGWRLTYAGADWLSLLEVGDYMAPMGFSPVPQLPLDYMPVLEQAVIEQMKRENGDMDGAAAARSARDDFAGSAQTVLEPRATEDTTVVPDWD